MSKAILLSIKPDWLVKILNREKTTEVRKLFRKDYVGWIYLYCSKGNDRLWKEDRYYWHSTKVGATQNDLNGKVVARFWCDKVDKWDIWQEGLEEKVKLACLSVKEFDDYSKGQVAYAIHISKLEIFDKPRELSEFQLWCNNICTNCKHLKMFDQTLRCKKPMLTKAPQNYCYVEGE